MHYINEKAPRGIMIKEAKLSSASHGVGIRTYSANPRLVLYGLPVVKMGKLSIFFACPCVKRRQ